MEPLARYEVRTARGYGLSVGVMVAAGAGATALLVLEIDMLARASFGGRELFLAGMTALLALVPVAWYLGTAAYRVGGGRSEIRFFADRLEVPAAGRLAWVGLARERMRMAARAQNVLVLFFVAPAGKFRRGEILTLTDGVCIRSISSTTLADEDWLDGFKADLVRFMAGERPLGPPSSPHHGTRVSRGAG